MYSFYYIINILRATHSLDKGLYIVSSYLIFYDPHIQNKSRNNRCICTSIKLEYLLRKASQLSFDHAPDQHHACFLII